MSWQVSPTRPGVQGWWHMESVHCMRDILTCLLCELSAGRFVSGLAKSSRSRQYLRHLQATPSSFITRLACGCVRGELMASRCEHVRRAASASLRALRTIHLSQAGQDCPIWPKTVKARTAEGPRECSARELSEVICNVAGYFREVRALIRSETLLPQVQRLSRRSVNSLPGHIVWLLAREQCGSGFLRRRDSPSTSHCFCLASDITAGSCDAGLLP